MKQKEMNELVARLEEELLKPLLKRVFALMEKNKGKGR